MSNDKAKPAVERLTDDDQPWPQRWLKLKEKYAELESELSSLRHQLRKLVEMRTKLHTEHYWSQEETERFDATLAALGTEGQTMSDKNEPAVERPTEAATDYEEWQKDVERLLLDKQDLESELSSLRRERDQLKQELEDEYSADVQIQEIARLNEEDRDKLAKQVEELEAVLRQLVEAMRGGKFPNVPFLTHGTKPNAC